MGILNLKPWNNVVKKSNTIKVDYYKALPIWQKIKPLLTEIESLHDEYDIMEDEYFGPKDTTTNLSDSTKTVTKKELIEMIAKINKLSETCNVYIREGRPIALEMWGIYQEIITSSIYDDVRNTPGISLINQDIYGLYLNFWNTTLRTIGHWTEMGAVWTEPEY